MKGNKLLLFAVFWPIISSFISYIIGKYNKKYRDYFAMMVTVVEFLTIIFLAKVANNQAPPIFEWAGFCGSRIYLKLDGFRYVYVVIASLMWMMTTFISHEYFAAYRNRNRYYTFMLITFGATVGVFLSADLLTTFVFFEIMSFASYVLVVHDEKPKTLEASNTYIVVTVISGMILLLGVFFLYNALGTTDMDKLLPVMQEYTGDKKVIYIASVLMLFGFGTKAGMFPMHIWLPKAHPVAPAPASALLSGILTKAGIFGALIISTNLFLHDEKWSLAVLIIGVITMLLGALLAVFSIDLKRTLACSSVSQIGFITVGIGMQGILAEHNALAVHGTLLHMVNHSLIKLVLFMAAGVIYMNLHELDLNKIRGFGRGKPLLAFIFSMGVLSIIGMPFWSGYLSKTLLHESIVEKIWLFKEYSSWSTFYQVVESIFTFTGGLTTAYMLKIFIAIFIEENPYSQAKNDSFNKNYMSPLSTFALIVPALMLLVLGVYPEIMNSIAKFGQVFMHGHDPAHAVEYFVWANLKGAVASLVIGVIVYFFIVRGCLMARDRNNHRIYIDAWPEVLNLEEYIYKPLTFKVVPFIGTLFANLLDKIPLIFSLIPLIGEVFAKFLYNITSVFEIIGFEIFIWTKKNIYKPLENKINNISISLGDGSEAIGLHEILSGSLSYSLLLFAAGFSLVLIFLVFTQNIL